MRLSESETSLEPENILEQPDSQGFAPVFKNNRFLILWGGQIFSQLADKIYLVLTIAIVANQFQLPGQPISKWVSPITIAFTIPAVLFGSLAGVYVDRWQKKSILVISNLIRGVLVLALPAVLLFSQGKTILDIIPLGFGLMLAITFAVSTFTQFFAPAEQAVIPLIVDDCNLLAANSLYTTTMMALLIVGFAIGEPLLHIADNLGLQAGLGNGIGKEILVGGAYAIAGIILLALQTGEKLQDSEKEQPHPWQDIKDGIKYLGKNQRVRNALIQLVILFSIFAALVILAVSIADRIPQIEAEQFGFLLAAAGVGMGASAAILGSKGQNISRSRLSLIGSIGVAGSLTGLSFATQNLWFALVMTVLLGAFAALVGVPMQTTIQSKTPVEMRGKVFGLQNNAVNIALSLPLVLAAEAETRFGLPLVILGLAAIALLGGVLTWYMMRNED
ncbi:MFS transporter [Waterburya agarophytonicola K14]|uniref:MFS transporter n=1 Tax=Waterburya agarophytonicola KI4 TaxID=2874699 RepID=A0A964BR69_9CYAN|nr:MFS transporter [Waterburya agarophytonicola]MCC0177277.1 MFS transporter [Waterburya agarophytonicola KI4]